jgi:hypothetical protein
MGSFQRLRYQRFDLWSSLCRELVFAKRVLFKEPASLKNLHVTLSGICRGPSEMFSNNGSRWQRVVLQEKLLAEVENVCLPLADATLAHSIALKKK